MPAVRKTEVQALVPLLMGDWASVEDLAAALILKLDEARGTRVDYTVFLGAESPAKPWVALGPYPGRASARRAAEKALERLGGGTYVVVRNYSELSLKNYLQELDSLPSVTGDWEEVRRDARAFKNGWRGGKSPGRREDYLGR